MVFAAAPEVVSDRDGRATLVESSVNEKDLAWTMLIDLMAVSSSWLQLRRDLTCQENRHNRIFCGATPTSSCQSVAPLGDLDGSLDPQLHGTQIQ